MLTEKQMEKCRSMDLLTYLSVKEPTNLIRLSDTEYCTEEHDSLKISNGKWMWWSRGIGGSTALDYLIKVKRMSFMEAALEVLGVIKGGVNYTKTDGKGDRKQAEKRLILPERALSNNKARIYLIGRCLAPGIITECMDKGLIFESLPMHCVIFLGKDENGIDRYAGFRSTNEDRLIGECTGSDKRFSFRLGNGKSRKIHVFESVIDLLSYATLIERKGGDYHKFNLLSLGGVFVKKKDKTPEKLPAALGFYLEVHPDTDTVFLHLDNDRAGWQATEDIQELLKNKCKVIDNPPPYGKDVNDFLCLQEP